MRLTYIPGVHDDSYTVTTDCFNLAFVLHDFNKYFHSFT